MMTELLKWLFEVSPSITRFDVLVIVLLTILLTSAVAYVLHKIYSGAVEAGKATAEVQNHTITAQERLIAVRENELRNMTDAYQQTSQVFAVTYQHAVSLENQVQTLQFQMANRAAITPQALDGLLREAVTGQFVAAYAYRTLYAMRQLSILRTVVDYFYFQKDAIDSNEWHEAQSQLNSVDAELLKTINSYVPILNAIYEQRPGTEWPRDQPDFAILEQGMTMLKAIRQQLIPRVFPMVGGLHQDVRQEIIDLLELNEDGTPKDMGSGG